MGTYRHRLQHYRRLSPRAIKIGLFVLGLVLLIDIVSARFSAQIQSALTLPVTHTNNGTVLQLPRMANGTKTHAASTMTTTTATTPVATTTISIGPPANVLAQDSFQRADQQFWGTASDGQSWAGDAVKAPAFAIVNHAGQVSNGSGIYDALLGPRAANTEIVFSASVSHFGDAVIGALLRWTDANNLYKVFIDGTNLTVLRKVAGVVSVLQSVPFPAQDGQSYTLRVRMVGSSISARVWQTGQTEPSTWMVNAADNMLSSGYDGLRLIVQTGITITVTMFAESKA